MRWPIMKAFKWIAPEDYNSIVQAAAIKVLDQVKEALIKPCIESMLRSLGHSDAVFLAADELAKRTGDSEEDVLLKALSLYEAAIEGKEKGLRVILVGPDYKYIKEIVGFEKTTEPTKT
jgi:hypothetical protein